jgi:hypothetical protein
MISPSRAYAIKTVLIAAMVCLYTAYINAQAPGYMGKKNVAGYGFNFGPALIGATPGPVPLNMIHDFSIDHALGSKWLGGISLRYYQTIYDNRAPLYGSSVYPSSNYFIRGFTIALNFKHFGRNYVAPWGSYFMMCPVVNIVRTSYDPYMHVLDKTKDQRDTLLFDFGPTKQTFINPDILFGWGKSRIIADKFVIDYGLNFQLFAVLAPLTRILDDLKLSESDYISSTYRNRTDGVNRLNLYIRLGYLF